MRPALALLLLGASLLLAAPNAAADPTAPFATASGTCGPQRNDAGDPVTPGDTVVSGAPASATHDNVLVRLALPGGGGTWRSVDPAGPTVFAGRLGSLPAYERYYAHTINWRSFGSLQSGHAPTLELFCETDTTYEVGWFDVPTFPVSFTGTGKAQLPFQLAAPDALQADVQFSQGTMGLDLGRQVKLTITPALFTSPYRRFDLTGPGQVVLGDVKSGLNFLNVTGDDASTWTITLSKAPPALSGVAFPQRWLRPGRNGVATYTCSRPTKLTATVRDSKGLAIRTLVQNAQITAAALSGPLTWDGRDSAGNPVPDGAYTIHVDSVEGAVSSSADAPVVVDGTPPDLSVTSASPHTHGSRIRLSASDSGSGLAQAELYVDGHAVGPLAQGQHTYRPAHGWHVGRHRVTLLATDNAGNAQRAAQEFRVRRAAHHAHRKRRRRQ